MRSVGVLLIGHSRNLEFCLKNLVPFLTAITGEIGRLSQWSLVLSSIDGSDSNRSVEATIAEESGVGSIPISFVEIRTAALSNEDQELFDRASTLGNPFRDRTMRTLRNVVHFLNLSKFSLRAMTFDTDFLIVCRSDLVGLGQPTLGVKFNPEIHVHSPAWHRWGGMNDRFGVLRKEQVSRYLGRVEQSPDFFRRGNPLSPEKFLDFSLEGVSRIADVQTKFARTRQGALIVNEDFKSDRLAARIRRNIARPARDLSGRV